MEVANVHISLLDDVFFQELLSAATVSVERTVEKYKTTSTWQMLGFYDEDVLVGIAGYEKVSQQKAVLLHIAVEAQRRGRGVGWQMIAHICKVERITTLEAETDRSAVDFYRKCGFQVTSLGEKYPGVERFLCVLQVASEQGGQSV